MNKSTITLLSSITLGAVIGLMAVARFEKHAEIECSDVAKIGALPRDTQRQAEWPVVTSN